MLHLARLFSFFAFICVCLCIESYDHQTTTYNANKKPVSVSSGYFSITPYFSPDTSIEVETWLIGNATSTIELGIPGFSSWSGCTQFEGPIIGCGVEFVRNQEQFPIFQALLNAIHRGVQVTILTNWYETPTTKGLITPLDFLALAGAKVRYFTTLSFLHTKYIQIDGKKASVSSINFSFTSFMENREAGVIFSGSGAQPIFNFLSSTFNFDYNQGIQWPTNSYNASDMKIINDKSPVPVVIPPPKYYKGAYVTSLQTVSATMEEVEIIDSPDFAWSTISEALNNTKSEFQLYIYQVTDNAFCDKIEELSKKVSYFTMLVSNVIYDASDSAAAQKCYEKLYNANVKYFKKTAESMYTYSHQKYWILDGKTVFLSTGNWSPTDYPLGGPSYPPPGNPGWLKTNRDYTIKITNPQIVSIFKNVLSEDFTRGHDYSPPSMK